MRWSPSWRNDPEARAVADRHYNRQSPGASGFMPPGRALVLKIGSLAVWGSSWPYAEYVMHEWAGAWMNSLFRNEGAGLSSELITEAVAATMGEWGPPPELGFVTFVDAGKVRRKRDPGRCYRRAGWRHVGFTRGGLWAFQLPVEDFPEPVKLGQQRLI